MSETCTFSALIDESILRSQRQDRRSDLVSYARSTIRECQVLAFFEQDMIEDTLNVDAVPFLWERPIRLRTMLAARPDIVGRRGKRIWFKNRPPGQVVKDEEYYLYLSGASYVFTGDALGVGAEIDVAYFNYSRKFVYYAIADRPATFDAESETWSYHADYDIDATTRATARELVSNWLVFRWYDLVLEGMLAKVFKSVGDPRSKTAFALYKQFQKDLLASERVVLLNQDDTNG